MEVNGHKKQYRFQNRQSEKRDLAAICRGRINRPRFIESSVEALFVWRAGTDYAPTPLFFLAAAILAGRRYAR